MNLPPPVVGTTITVPSSTYPLYNDGGRNYAIQVQARAPYLVTTNSDSGPGSLRQAVLNASAVGGENIITFTNTLSGQIITLTNGQIELTTNVTIDASTLPGGIAISGNGASRVFATGTNVTVTLTALTITNGFASNPSYGGGVINYSPNSTLTLNRCTVAGNASPLEGGGLYNIGAAIVNECTFTGNWTGGNGGAGIYNDGNMIINQSTVSGNSSTTTGRGGGVVTYFGTLAMTNTIVAGNTAPSGLDLWYGSFTGVNNLTNGAPELAAPGSYGGPTQTMPPLAGSPAIDAGNDSVTNFLATDQRGYPRRSGVHVDIGAVEVNTNTIVTTAADNGVAGSLRNVVANTTNTDLISFALNLSGQTIVLTNGQIELGNNVTIDGSALTNGIAINGNASSRVFEVDGGVTAALNTLTITNASSPFGGGIGNMGTLTVKNCTFVNNQASNFSDGGGAIENWDDATTTVVNSTFTGNQVQGANNDGGGAIVAEGGTLTVINSTFIGNSAAGNYGGGIHCFGTLLMTNSIVCSNIAFAAPNVSAVYSVTNNLVDTNAMLAPLGYYGGPTLTMPPLAGSPAIDAGSDAVTNFLATDQRGYRRLAGAHVDIGAVELQTPFLTVTANSDDANSGTLRNIIAGADTGSTITFTNTLSGQTITLASGQITITNNLTIDGSALANAIRIQDNSDRMFQINSGATVVMNSLILTNGNCSSAGGAILNEGGNLTLNRSTLAGNLSMDDGGGGAIFNDVNSVLTLNQCTLSANHCLEQGGAIYNFTPATLTLVNCTISGNTADEMFSSRGASGGGGVLNSGTLFLTDTIVAGNNDSVAANISGSFTGANNLTSGNPLLAALGNYGGPTPTMPPLAGSPAIDAGGAALFTTDQRGYPRPLGLAADIGAVEGISNTNSERLTGALRSGNGLVQFSFTNFTDESFSVWAATNLAQPLNTWTPIGPAVESPVGSGHFQFTDPQTPANYPRRFYRVTEP